MKPQITLALSTTLACLASTTFASSLGKDLSEQLCLGCHTPTDTGLSRISQQRKTPEGWEMTINRMRVMHGLQLVSGNLSEGEILGALVKHFGDTQGLAPSETAPFRYLIEHDYNQVESMDPLIGETCGRCHSGARVALQRRAPDEWNMLVDFHLGQWPSTEYSLYGRDREWLKIAREQVVPRLSSEYALDDPAWAEWQAAPKPELEGEWTLASYLPGKGYFSAQMTTERTEDDTFSVSFDGAFLDGTPLSGTGAALVYTGYEWRGSVNLLGLDIRQAFAASEDGSQLVGRMYQSDQDAIGATIVASKVLDKPIITGLQPPHIKQGTTSTITLTGANLDPNRIKVNGVSLIEASVINAHSVALKVSADKAVGSATVSIEGAEDEASLMVYDTVDAISIEPAYSVARIGANGGHTGKVNSVFAATGRSAGADGKVGTEDDLILGYLDDVVWRAVPRDAQAEADEDLKFAGQMDTDTGFFEPAGAGPNPARFRATNNAGNLNVEAQYNNGDTTLSASARLLVTVQRWNNPPLK